MTAYHPKQTLPGGAVNELDHAADPYRDIVLDRARIIRRFDDRFADALKAQREQPSTG